MSAVRPVLALTMPGLQSTDADRSGITLQTYVDAVVAAIDDSDDEHVVLVGHSAGGSHAHLAVDARPDRVARAVPVPARVAHDLIELSNPARHDVPITGITCAMSSGELKQAQHPEHPWSGYLTELAAGTDVTYVDLPTGHWPQFRKPHELASAVVAAIE